MRGWGVATIQTVDVAIARQFVPHGCTLVPVAPRKTLGGLLFVSYESGSTLAYRELTVVAGLVRVGGRIAFYLTRLYVDSAASIAGGRAIWGVPKHMAHFTIERNGDERRIVVQCDDLPVCSLRYRDPRRVVPLPLLMPAMGTQPGCLLFFTAQLTARLGLTHATVEAAGGGEITALQLDRPFGAIALHDFRMRVPAPSVVRRADRSRSV